MYIHERENWTEFRWDADSVSPLVEEANRKLGMLYGRLDGLGLDSKLRATAENLTRNTVCSSEIEGIRLNIDEVRSSLAYKLGIENVKYRSPSHYTESIVSAMLDAMEHYDRELTKEILCGWQAAFFPTGYSGGVPIEVGIYRTHEEHIESGALGREKIHYVAPSPARIEGEMQRFLEWFNAASPVSFIIRSAIAHLWFVSIHPFEDGNGRIARILSDIMLARADRSPYRFYNISSEINKNKGSYYNILERTTTRDDSDITEWLVWYVNTLISALGEANATISGTLNKAFFWQRVSGVSLSERQVRVLNLFLDGYEAKITSKSWARLAGCSKDTAIRDIRDLVEKQILRDELPGAKRPHFSIIYRTGEIVSLFSNVAIEKRGKSAYLKATYRGETPVCEKISKLDADLYDKGLLTIESLLKKYCSYLGVAE